jgi:hypothetical protein
LVSRGSHGTNRVYDGGAKPVKPPPRESSCLRTLAGLEVRLGISVCPIMDNMFLKLFAGKSYFQQTASKTCFLELNYYVYLL